MFSIDILSLDLVLYPAEPAALSSVGRIVKGVDPDHRTAATLQINAVSSYFEPLIYKLVTVDRA